MKKDKKVDRLQYEKNFIDENTSNQMLHDDNSDESLDLIEWEDDGKGNYISI